MTEARRRVASRRVLWSSSRRLRRERHMDPAMASESERVLVRPSRDADVPAMLAIYLHHIRKGVDPRHHGDIETPDAEDLKRRRKSMLRRKMPHIVAEQDGIVLGYAYAVPFRKRPGLSLHGQALDLYPPGPTATRSRAAADGGVDRRLRGGGLSPDDRLYRRGQRASLAIHEKFGFRQVGFLPQVGFKFGHWTDTVMVQRSLGLGGTAPPEP